jgi:accessory gene regulator protein AgrB
MQLRQSLRNLQASRRILHVHAWVISPRNPRKSELCVSFEDWKKTGRNAPKGQCHIIGRSRSRGVWLGKLWEQSAGDVYYTADRILLWLSAGKFFAMLLIFPLRKNAGGYHAETKSRCLLYSSAILFVSVICFVQVEWLDLGYILVAGFFFAIIFLLAPVENDNKRLELVEYRVYRKRARIILLLEGTLFATAVTFKWEELIAVITIVFFIVGMSLIIGKVKLWCTIYKKVER